MKSVRVVRRRLLCGILLSAWVLLPAAGQGAALAPLPAPKAQKPAQAELGRYLFFDPRMSGDGGISCATCHQPARGWGDGQALSAGYPGSKYFRNAQTLLNAAYNKRVFWDGRLSGADLPTLVRDHLTEAHFMLVDGRLFPERLKQVPSYVKMFQEAYGGEPSFGGALKAISAFLHTIASKNVPFDNYLKSDKKALSAEAQKGLALFKGKAGCAGCHNGALLSDGGFHALGVPENEQIFKDPLRHITFRRFNKVIGVPNFMNLRADPGLYVVTKQESDRGKFRTPTLREVARTAPYMHNGAFAALEDVVAFYDKGGGSGPNKSARLKPLGLSADERKALVEFLMSLSGETVSAEAPKIPDYELRKLGDN